MLKITRKKNNIPNLKHRIKQLSKQTLSFGYYDEQGYHKTDRPNADPIKYVDLIKIHAGGSTKKNIPARPVLPIAAFTFKPSRVFKDTLRKYFSKIDQKSPPIKASFVYGRLGEEIVTYGRTIFGDTKYLAANKDSTIAYKGSIGSPYSTSPLMEFGGLKAALSYRINGVVVTPT